MNQKLRILLWVITVSFLVGTLPSTAALAGSSLSSSNQTSAGTIKLAQIKNNPCGKPAHVPGTVDLFMCSGYGGTGSWIAFPLRTWATEPEYPLANYPFYIALGTKTISNPWHFPIGNKTYPELVDIRGIKTKIKLVAVKQQLSPFVIDKTNFNGMLDCSADDHMTTCCSPLTNRWHDEVETELEKVFGESKPDTESATTEEYYENTAGVVDTAILRGFSLNSSYFATNPTYYRGEPAYRLSLISYYEVYAMVSWQKHRFWEYLPAGTKTVCMPGSGSGESCITPDGQLGHQVTKTVYAWQWGGWHEGEESGWKFVGGTQTDSVIWPDGSIHDHMPLVVYQSQPLLSQP